MPFREIQLISSHCAISYPKAGQFVRRMGTRKRLKKQYGNQALSEAMSIALRVAVLLDRR